MQVVEMGVKYMSKGQFNLQDAFLNQVRKEKMPVTIFLVNGFQIKGAVKGFDNFTVVVELDNKQQLVYKHAISTVAPLKPVNIANLDANKNEEA
jgi:host factor-I protein